MSPSRPTDATSTPSYNHTQVGYVTGTALALGTLIAYASFQVEEGTLGWMGLAIVSGLGIGAVLFSSLTVAIEDDVLRFYFGPGFWERRIPLSDIHNVRIVRNSAWDGWGIRSTTHGWLYNVSGLRAVELTVRDEGTLRIGTDEPEQLKDALDQALGTD